ncbi:urease accessory protein UreF [Kamptonema animale CS-326]|uniref:urease accessory protein UreF n=1 Tax=Kamptonema animale TaxID=92934 RepID=UPI00232F099D|nr:urease accessory protein UreF [Kamptonema animale]MDB9512490.1 urease accessory protein UreF [Kamptonema animale CS-326]
MDYQFSILRLLQLATVPVGAYSYSEGIETLVDFAKINNENCLQKWLEHSLQYGAIRLEAAVMVRAYRATIVGDLEALSYWNAWATAAKETEELRLQSWQMGRSLVRLLQDIQLPLQVKVLPSVQELTEVCGNNCNFAIAFGIAAVKLEIEEGAAVLGYLYSWAANLVNAGVKLIPLGQTVGQQLLLNLDSQINFVAQEVLRLEDDNLNSCSWGLALASMAHENQYTRLFRS